MVSDKWYEVTYELSMKLWNKMVRSYLKLLILFGIKRTSSIAMDNLVGCTFSFWNLKFFY